MNFMERLERLAEFAVRMGVLRNGYKYTVTTGKDLKSPYALAGVTMTTRVEHPTLGTHLQYNKVDPKKSSYDTSRKPYTEIGMINVPKYHPEDAHLAEEARRPLRGKYAGGKSAVNVSDVVMSHLAKNRARVKYVALPMAKKGEAGIHDADRLNNHYITGSKKYGYTHRAGGLLGMDQLLPPKRPRE